MYRDRGQWWVLQGKLSHRSAYYWRPQIFQTPNRRLLHLSRACQRLRCISNLTSGYNSRGYYSGINQPKIQHIRRGNNNIMRWYKRDQKIHGQWYKILMLIKPLWPHIGNLSQNTKIASNIVLATCKRTPILSNRGPGQMVHAKCGVRNRGKTEMGTRLVSRVYQDKVSQHPIWELETFHKRPHILRS